MRPIVFVSSIVDGFRDYRQAAREGIEAGGGRPLLVNEDLPSLATSPRNACLDAIDSSDYVVSIAAGRGGWKAPSGLLVVEEELEHARHRNLRVLGFVQDTPRDANAERFARRISDFVSGGFRTTFNTPVELRAQVERAVREVVSNLPEERPMDADLSQYFSALDRYSGQTAMLRFVLVPEREHELVDPMTLNSSGFKTRLYEIGLQSDVGLLDHESAKSSELRDDTRVVEQSPGSRHGEGEYVHLEVSESGRVVIDMNITGRVPRNSLQDMTGTFTVSLGDVETVLQTCFRFVRALYGALDPYSRHERFHYNVALFGLGYRTLERNPKSRSSHTMSMRGPQPIAAYDRSRVMGRAALAEPANEIERTVALLERRTPD
jgi:hypothetical protein